VGLELRWSDDAFSFAINPLTGFDTIFLAAALTGFF